MTRIANFAALFQAAREAGPKTIAIAAAHEKEVLQAAQAAEAERMAECILVGDQAAIESLARCAGVDLSHMDVIDEPDPKRAAAMVMTLVRQGQAQIGMKGRIETGDFLRAALDRELGLRRGRLLSHVGIFEIPGFSRLIFVTDAGVVVAPDIVQKVEIVQNAIEVALALGIEQPKVAVLAATEMVNPKIPTTMDAANLAKMADRGQIRGGIVDGPLALDNAISDESSSIKGIRSPVAGQADILVAPDVEAGNMLAKAITYFAKGRMAGVVVGGQSPLIVASRSDPHETKLLSIALGVVLASWARP
ncbi:MAG TPA: bifunctional enoyl-CoA hydratase/phosphate acetyltransferase [Anaerolineae bacterium]|nr:bifunctional enoyl-CoA hydratase/phosphate acetyltransferase [Anaerolineae bacterium]HOR00694.1 bifunctional enoyl-CoA hydratase/phosphate acetyltransferase [Anaerolineae bacterium]HPL27256.1 bifunctional enoyl-CoA hydratase/phosphate acetyltransferase [Anaerolineae bacterium]HPL27267.1 bifunctional enoyl-CoA hydratase/phosphate acetyltransferase [Anaerolineae bacterium]